MSHGPGGERGDIRARVWCREELRGRPRHRLADLSARRLAMAELAAAAKWSTGSPR
ncbi:hypothetical protein [Streptomyces sp. H27-C3]|uniref:hypothetical protein n=1 Tax=Streptomyces sp. H27-C3 TaxID=3046305 RepID=UPI0024B9CC81|nr:hypothetical protein [Streptomyces sp. H27-C3]MDJ0467059.1 hypothetical protein [Streptomyces sp. H27-C3]